MPQSFVKTPQAVIDYTVNWDDGYLSTGETISTSSWTVEPASTSFSISTASFTNTTATIDVTGGLHGDDFHLRNRVVTSGGRTDTRTLQIKVWGPR